MPDGNFPLALQDRLHTTNKVSVMDPMRRWVIGMGAGVVEYVFAIGVQKLRIDDPLDASAVHMGDFTHTHTHIQTLPLYLSLTLSVTRSLCHSLSLSFIPSGCGLFGLVCGGLFGTRTNTDAAMSTDQPCGAFYPGCGATQLGVNVLGGAMICLWCMTLATTIFGLLKFAGILRVHPKMETDGLDLSYHRGSAYHEDANKLAEPVAEEPASDA